MLSTFNSKVPLKNKHIKQDTNTLIREMNKKRRVIGIRGEAYL